MLTRRRLLALKKLIDVPGPAEQESMNECAENGDANCLGTCQLYDVEEGRKALKEDRVAIIDALTDELTSRFVSNTR
eukprot:scaffold318792_cov24-Tisochrysis_lutea.AAC.1